MTRPIYQVKAEFFRTLAHPARIRILEVLRDGERPVHELLGEIDIEAPHLSQQLAVLRKAGVVEGRRSGSTVIYDVADRRIFDLLSVAKEILTASLQASKGLLDDLERLDFEVRPRPRRRR